MAPEEECEREMVVLTPWERDTLAVPLAQFEVLHADEETQQGVADWRYWIARGYELLQRYGVVGGISAITSMRRSRTAPA
jgi:hypothetical protein